MTKRNEPISGDAHDQAALYASGALTPEERRDFEARVAAGQTDLAAEWAAMQKLVPQLARLAEPVAPSPATRAEVLRQAAPEARDAAAPSPQIWRQWSSTSELEALFTLRKDAGEWEPTGEPGVEVRRLFVDRPNNRMTAMFRMAPGSSYPSHTHDGAEECYVLAGDLHVGEIVMTAGDYQRAPEGSQHGVQRTVGGCLLLVSSSLSDEM
jgi:anti-sigma factor ChrR (cupin superfamily)